MYIITVVVVVIVYKSLGGYLYLDDVMSLPNFKRYSLDKVKEIVSSNDKQRFSIRPHPASGRLQIRANQGHSIQVINYSSILNTL